MDMNNEMFGTAKTRIRVGKMRMKPDMSRSEWQITTGYQTESGYVEYQRLTGTVAENVGYEQWFGIIGDGTRISNKSLEQDTSKSECQIKTGDQTESEVMEC